MALLVLSVAFAWTAWRSALAGPPQSAIGDPPGSMEAPPTATDAPAAPSLLDRVALIGASATSGFNIVADVDVDGRTHRLPVDLGDLLTCVRRDGAAPVVEASSFLFFTNPGPMGSTFAKRALDADPTLVVAVDFLFWFGYGVVEGDEIPARVALLEQGLAFLDQFSCPIIVGDFPDMSEAIGTMLHRSQVPSPNALRALNERLTTWIAERGADLDGRPKRARAVRFGLAEFVAKARSGRAITIAGQTWAPEQVGGLLQDDRLHPTLDGLLAVALAVSEQAANLDPHLLQSAFVKQTDQVRACLQASLEARVRAKLDRLAGPAAAGGERPSNK